MTNTRVEGLKEAILAEELLGKKNLGGLSPNNKRVRLAVRTHLAQEEARKKDPGPMTRQQRRAMERKL